MEASNSWATWQTANARLFNGKLLLMGHEIYESNGLIVTEST